MKLLSLLSVVATVVATASARDSINLKPKYDPELLASSDNANCPHQCRVKKYDGVVHEKKCLERFAVCMDDPKITVSWLINIFADADSFEATYTLVRSGGHNDFILENVLLPDGTTLNGHAITSEKDFQDYMNTLP
ncbi:hypothetical protein F441_06861 [Phytophthora nicotianae CJ01A1]|uniref:Uncharacterized protein n=5 Tax=Phytophthora nicotianae TaxID=4792 RepID=V9FCN5_PHYNI|nr:hypothetical protein F443_06858 [Phytophthora nicotianae P1569]ETK89122.1 hypothetical protein L915_06726 [Phytophthora nicotianae]ETO77957.1 hypothetical protein F444_06924 [Phytophthora nicotianae P1976]ETP18992.1 hypothetical protein F441_06861 [Phytophthora nicotianae CJ01A1]ETP46931.1 hypothetical protein F442_06898 [Phytophthora nicotianae P10297]